DPTTELNSQFHDINTSLRFADIDNDGIDELIVFDYPYSYILKFENGQNKIISYKENVNSNSIFVGDLNRDGVPDVAFPTNSGINFYEFTPSNFASTPYNLTGCSVDSTKIKLQWNGNVNKYLIFKGTNQDSLSLFDSTSTTDFIDSTVKSGINYFYGIKAYDPAKQNPLSNLSNVAEVYSHVPARLVNIKAVSQNNLLATFSERVNNKIDNLNSFEVAGIGIPNSVSAASQYSYLLTFDKNFALGNNTFIVKDLNDFFGSPIYPDTLDFNFDSTIVVSNFFITNFEIINSQKVSLTFNLDVDSISASNLSNYILTPANNISSVQLNNQNKKIIYLIFDGQKPVGSIGIAYSLHVKNLVSSFETGNIKINSGAGSFIVLTGFAQNLSGVYVYPNPARIIDGTDKITFADLPKRAKITIFNLSGRKINQLEENNNNGGIDYNLKDENGNLLPSGIYIFRAERLDNSNNVVEEKLGKFAVIR
ncbi:MAG: T9SS type A sorting domain-containing protein, partial [Actinobacteria bacterium]|nr:T9SS type A sorting domain-containing protein [Actinomycetota bacterium]